MAASDAADCEPTEGTAHRRALFVFRHVFGHHVSNAEAFVEVLQGAGWGVHVLADPKLESLLPDLPFLGRADSIEFDLGRSVVGPWTRIEAACQRHAVDLIVLVTFDEWLIDLARRPPWQAPLSRPVFGVLHHLTKSGGGLRRVQRVLARRGWLRALPAMPRLQVACLTDPCHAEATALNPAVRTRRIPYVHKLERPALPRAPAAGEPVRLLVFGALRQDKRLVELVEDLASAAGASAPIELTLAGRFPSPDYARRVRGAVAAAGSSGLTVSLEEGFVADDRKQGLFAEHHLVVVSNAGGDFEGKMISAVLLDAVHYRKPVVCVDALPVPAELGDLAAPFRPGDPGSLRAALDRQLARYDKLVAACDTLAGARADDFRQQLTAAARELVDG